METTFCRYLGRKGQHYNSGAVGVVVRDDTNPGVFRGHVDVWFGEKTKNGLPVLCQILATEIEMVPLHIMPDGE